MKAQAAHIGINVTDLTRSRDFYESVFHLTTVGGSDAAPRRYAFLGDGDRLVLTLWEQAEGRFAPKTPGLHHLSFEVETVDDVRALESRLKERRVPMIYDGIVPHAEGAGSGGVFFEDPDGTRLEVFTKSGVSAAAPSDGPSCGFF